MAGVDHGWDPQELNRAAGELFIGLSAVALDSVPTIDFDTGTPDGTANPNAESLGYTAEGWTASAKPTIEGDRVDEEEDPVEDFITTNEVTIAGTIRQVKNLARLAKLTPGAVYHAVAGGIEKITGGGKRSFNYMTAMLIWEDHQEPGVFWAFVLYKCVNSAGLEIAVGRTKGSAVAITLSGRAVSTRTAGDRTFAFVRYEEVVGP